MKEEQKTPLCWIFLSICFLALVGHWMSQTVEAQRDYQRCDRILLENCTVNSCEQVAQECYQPCSPEPCTRVITNCRTYDLFFSLSYNGQNYTQKERTDLGCPKTISCRFYPCSISSTLTLNQPYIYFEWTFLKIQIVFQVIFIIFYLIALLASIVECYNLRKTSPGVQLQETA